ncbi:adhesive plaque matrix protein-like [Anopheles merus]|uniref:adhesive plaque matrix protein-like n=1 Tax=Anopheles merus TaxID=30066 RepID=UPI001BE3F88A|nr:adhesive plaque matrix protein-like [Anopheles merus]
MRGVTMSVGTPVTLAVILGLCTILEATYLERPLWVADKGRPQSVSFAQEQARTGQAVQAANEQSWMIPEPYYPSRTATGSDGFEGLPQRPQEQSNIEQKMREERPMVESFQPNWPYEHQEMYYGQGAAGEPQASWLPEQEKLVELPKPSEPTVVDAWNQFQLKPEFEYPAFNGQQTWQMEPKPEAAQPQAGQEEQQSYQPKPEEQPEPSPPKVQEMPQTYGNPQAGYEPSYQGQQAYNSYPPRPELYRPVPSYGEPSYPTQYYGQQSFQYMPEPVYEMQVPVYRKPAVPSVKPQSEPTRVSKPQQEQGPKPDYYPYQPQEWYPYQMSTQDRQAPMQVEPDVRAQSNLAVQPTYPREQPKRPAPVDRAPQPNRQPAQPSRPVAPRPSRPIERQPEQPIVTVPSAPWEMQYKPLAPPKPKPPVQRPSYYEDADDDDSEEVVKYEKPITRMDARCPRNDDPAKPVHFPSETSCVKFQKCFNGIAYEMSCPPGLEFDAKNNRCDYPARARCSI